MKCICGFDDEATKEKDYNNEKLEFIRYEIEHAILHKDEDGDPYSDSYLFVCPKCRTVRI